MYFSLFSARHLKSPSLNLSANSLIINNLNHYETTGISCGITYLKLHILCAAPLNFPEK